MKELVEHIAKAIVDFPDEVVVREVAGQQSTVIELEVAKGDLGKIIGRSGRTASAIRTLLFAAGRKNDRRVVLEILE